MAEWGQCSAVSGRDGERLLEAVSPAHPMWSGLPMMVQLLPGQAIARDLQLHHACLAVAVSGRGKRRYASGHHVRELYSSPTMFELYGGGYGVDCAEWQGVAGEVVGIQFPAGHVNRLLHAEGSGFQLPTVHELFDERITSLVHLLWSEARDGGPRGPLYSEGLSLALLGLLIEHHAASRHADTRSHSRLSPAQRDHVREFIEQNLSGSLSVEVLADLVGMSAAHFARAFKATFDLSPHAYVSERRISIACSRLSQDAMASLATVAADLGFSSQSHFTEAFKRKVGVTPGRWRTRSMD